MNALAVLTGRELRSHAPLAAVAAAAALLPWVAPLLPGLSRHPAADVRQATAAIVAVLLGAGLALLVGSGLVARDLAEGRLGFHLTLPVAGTTVWLARLAAGVAVVYGAMAAALLPLAGSFHSFALQQDAVLMGLPLSWAEIAWLERLPLAGALLVPLVFVLVAHQLAVALRARTPWLLLEIVGFGAAAMIAADTSARLLSATAPTEMSVAVATTVLGALLAIVGGGAAGMASGRVLLGRFHRAQAVVATAGTLLAATAAAAYAGWVLSPGVGAVSRIEAAAGAPGGEWVTALVELEGRPSYVPWVLYNARTGAWATLAPGWGGPWNSSVPVTFAADGGSAVWWRGRDGRRHEGVVRIDLTGDEPRFVETGIEIPFGGDVALSADGRWIGVRGRDELSVWTGDGRGLLASAKLPRRSGTERLQFVGSSLRHLRIGGDADSRILELRELDPHRRRLRVAAPVPLPNGEGVLATFSPDGDRLLVDGGAGAGVTLHDGATGARIAEVAPAAPFGGMRRTAFLADGRIVAPVLGPAGLTLRLLAADGSPLAEVALGTGRSALPVAEPRLGVVQVSVRTAEGWGLREVDFAAGSVRPIAPALLPAAAGSAVWDPRPLPPPGDAALLWDASAGALVALEDGQATRVLPRPPS